MTQQDFMIILLGYERIYGFPGGGLERVEKEISEYNINSILETASKISLKLYSGGFSNNKTQVEIIKGIFAHNRDVRVKIVEAIRNIKIEGRKSSWAIFTEQPLLNLFKVALLYAKKEGGKLVSEKDVQKVGNWLLILNDLCMDSKLIHSFQLPPEIDREYLREYVTRQYFFMAKERMPYKVVRFKNIFDKIQKLHPKFDINQKFLDATGGCKLEDYISFCFFLMVNWVTKTTRVVDIKKEWIICKKKYFEQTTLTMKEIDNILPLLLLEISPFKKKYDEIIKKFLKGDDIFAFNFLQFRQRPLIPFNDDCFVCPSPEIFTDKATDGIYWIIENFLRDEGREDERRLFPSVWGNGFEEYVNDRLGNAFGDSYFKNPFDKKEEIADGLIFGLNALFFVETKYAHWSYMAKLTGSKESMISTLNQIFSSSKKVKGLGQLTRSIKKVELGKMTLPNPLESRKMVPILVVGEGMPLDWLNRFMYEKFSKEAGSFYENDNVLHFIVLDIEEVEILEAVALEKGSSEAEKLLLDYSNIFLKRSELGFVRESMQFKNYLYSINYPTPNNPSLFKLFDMVYKTAVKRGFKKSIKKIKKNKPKYPI